ncbi:zinc ABC transporter permease subunit ZnuB [Oceanibacterium hippocampi]|uniref:High-affinity zinc uptake system membrane protein ZnuB n=1 Tax=Oceanibacterium hippocampi TaxID=745714 RepID=A0A1Y5TD23_9PROT|nr:zinc ABC transporter permease subunit ZnuB [Oceanibacterium hippocampi]SLN59073.1 High-affinity zinc uptake system membrane protein ZnuB [Oceanibacterium hippocampi]
MPEDFLVRAALAGIGVALAAAPLGCFIVWRRMAYFGDTMAHSALLGVALGFLLGLAPTVGVILVTTGIAILLILLQQQRRLATDTLLGILSHSALSTGLVALSLMAWLRIDLMGYLFGDILAVTALDLYLVYGGGALVLATMAAIWRPLLAATVHEDLARAEGVPTLIVRLVFMLLVALVIAIAMKIVGILLITALLIIPAAAARRFARTPEQMAVMAALIGAVAVLLGLGGSFGFDTPSGPSVVVAAMLLFVLSLVPIGRRIDG